MLLDAPPSIAIEEIESAEGLEALRPAWEALWDRSSRATVFQHPDWLLAWWRHLGGGELWTLVVRRDGKMIGIAPLFVWSGPQARQVTQVGNGISDRIDLLAAPGLDDEIAAAVLAHLAESPRRWETADFRDLPIDSALLDARMPDGIVAEVEDDVPSHVLALPSGARELRDAIPARLHRTIRARARRLEEEAAVRWEAAEAETLDALLDVLFRLHAARWAERGEPGVLADSSVHRFHREAAARLLRCGMLRMHALRADGEPVAVYYGFHAKGRASYYLGGFDPAWKRHGVGKAAVAHAVQEALREGASVFDFLRGSEPYKAEWGTEERPARRLRLRRSAAGEGR
jgi:CelD/BcsL family acetyltransferase involved in cellulose biosynthesis